MIGRAFRRLVADPWARLDAASAARRAVATAAGGFDARPAIVLVLAAFILVFQRYCGDRADLAVYCNVERIDPRWYPLAALAWWSGAKLVGYFILPALTIRFVLRGRLRDYGLAVRGVGAHLHVYVILYAAILPILVVASHSQPFLDTYPFYREASRSWRDLIAWELIYGASFLALELFFRGFLIFALEPKLGLYAIFVPMIPYCMIHFGKPLAEVCGAIVAAIALGTLALATRSIWCGFLLHLSVAWTMDLLAIAHGSGFPRR